MSRDVTNVVVAIGSMDLEQLRSEWRRRYGAPPRLRSVQIMRQHLGIGARLTRSWKGRAVEVVVEEAGFRFEDRVFPSLSAAATAIAGSKWNGPRFFGLRDAS